MTPAEEMRTAAAKLREMAAMAPKGPWATERYFWKTRSAAMPDQWMVAVTDENGDHVTAVSERGDCNDPGGEHHLLAADTTAWIALMGPDKAEPLACWLDVAARMTDIGCRMAGRESLSVEQKAARDFARFILGGAS